jgi:Linalool dehydratase/isomerase
MTILNPKDSAKDEKLSLLPPLENLFGTVTRARIKRLLIGYALLTSLGSILFFMANQPQLQVFGLGLILPGGGFFADYDLDLHGGIWINVSAITAMVLFLISLGIWFGTGNVLAPPIVWFGAALLAANLNRNNAAPNHAITVVLFLVGVLLATIAIFLSIRFFLARRQRYKDNAYLLEQRELMGSIFTAPEQNACPEMSLEDLQRLRFLLDRALQPVDEFNGFEWLDQFQTAAVRYQLNFLGYGIALAQARYTPAFGGYGDMAQIKLLDKQTKHKVWAYWALENFWGNLRFDANPLRRENIMYTGFVALQMALFEASSGRNDFSQQGRFKLVHPSGKVYAYNDEELVQCLEKEYKASDFFLITCEPNWIYPLCNMMGASAILAYDSLRQKAKWCQYSSDFRRYLEAEFLDAFGRYVPCRSTLTGLALPSIGGAMPLAMPCFFLNAIAPDLALMQWLLLRRQLFDKHCQFRHQAFWRIDTGNYGFSRASAYAATALAAAELGDDEVYNNCISALEEDCPSQLKDGVIHRRYASVWSHGVEMMARATTQNSFRDLLLHPRNNSGLRLENINYPDVLVASAHADNVILKTVLYPGNNEGVYEVTLAGLKPNKHYRISGAKQSDIYADNHGNARLTVQLTGRTCLNVYQEESN